MGHAEVGAGTIVGSAVFNILVIIALSAALAGEVLHIDYRCIVRDGSFYAGSIILFIVFSNDAYFQWWESAILIACYFLYIAVMKFNRHYMDFMGRVCGVPKSAQVTPVDVEQAKQDTSKQDSAQMRRDKLGPSYGGSDSNLSKAKIRTDTLVSDASGTDDDDDDARKNGAPTIRTQDSIGGSTTLQQQQNCFSASEPDISKISHEERNTSARFIHKHKGELGQQITGISRASVRAGHHDSSPRGSNSAISSKSNRSIGGSRLKLDTTSTDMQPSNGADSDDSMVPPQPGEEGDGTEDLLTCRQRCCVPCFYVDQPALVMEPDISAFTRFRRFVAKLTFWMAAPHAWVFTNTIPAAMQKIKGDDVPRGGWVIIASFTSSIFWIMLLSWVMVFFVTKLGCILHIDRFTMALVVIAAGTSVPDALSSIMVARDGFGNMAVSNAIGSNVFDILLGLGFPYLLKALIDGEPLHLVADGVEQNRAYRKFGFILLGILSFTVISFAVSRWRLSKCIGVTFFLLYLCFIAYAIVQSLVCNGGRDC